MKIYYDVPHPMSARERIEILKAMQVKESIHIESEEEMRKWRYPMLKAMERGTCYISARKHPIIGFWIIRIA